MDVEAGEAMTNTHEELHVRDVPKGGLVGNVLPFKHDLWRRRYRRESAAKEATILETKPNLTAEMASRELTRLLGDAMAALTAKSQRDMLRK